MCSEGQLGAILGIGVVGELPQTLSSPNATVVFPGMVLP